jgi:hypothetical protein
MAADVIQVSDADCAAAESAHKPYARTESSWLSCNAIEQMADGDVMCRFLNTIIDDLFAFVIKMPTLHRLSVFRDDLGAWVSVFACHTIRGSCHTIALFRPIIAVVTR